MRCINLLFDIGTDIPLYAACTVGQINDDDENDCAIVTAYSVVNMTCKCM